MYERSRTRSLLLGIFSSCDWERESFLNSYRERIPIMKRNILIFITVLTFSFGALSPKAEAALPTFDAVNATLSQLRNAMLDSGFARQIAILLEELAELRAQYQEMLRFHAGWDDIVKSVIGDPLKEIFRFGKNRSFHSYSSSLPKLEIFEAAKEPESIRRALEDLTGKIPEGSHRPYIPFEEAQVVDGFHLAKVIRESGRQTREVSESIVDQAATASPKGAARLAAQALGHLIILGQENQEALAKIIELESVQIEQVSREEKRLENLRLSYMDEMNQAIETIGRID